MRGALERPAEPGAAEPDSWQTAGGSQSVAWQVKRFSKEIAQGVKRAADVLQQAALEGLRKEIETMLSRVQHVVQQTKPGCRPRHPRRR
jgi:hypothetical protein